MHTSRREFVQLTAAAGAMGLGLRTYPLNTPFVDRHRHTLRILILGGTGFIGPHMVRYALRPIGGAQTPICSLMLRSWWAIGATTSNP
jgi:hypothetical protein